MMENFAGIDHVVVTVGDLDRAAETWRRLGFTLSPRGTHSAHLGSANHTIMLDPDYIELLTVVTPTDHNRKSRDFLARREGIDRLAFTATDAEAGAAALRARDIDVTGPLDFGRPVQLPREGTAEARFRTIQWSEAERPAGIGIFACQHLTRDVVWIPELMKHPNTATRLERIEILAADPKAAAAHMARLIGSTPVADADGAQRVASGIGRAEMVFLTREALATRHPGITQDGLPTEGSACLSVRVADYSAAQHCIVASGVPAVIGADRLAVPASAATGILVELIAA